MQSAFTFFALSAETKSTLGSNKLAPNTDGSIFKLNVNLWTTSDAVPAVHALTPVVSSYPGPLKNLIHLMTIITTLASSFFIIKGPEEYTGNRSHFQEASHTGSLGQPLK